MTENIEKIIKIFENANISKMELEIDNIKLKLEKDGFQTEIIGNYHNKDVASKIEQRKTTVLNCTDETRLVKSPVVGTYYAQRSEKAKPFVEVGSKVKKGDVLCIIEAMKVMNEVTSPFDGTITEILVKNEELVQFDQIMIVLGDWIWFVKCL